MSPVQQRSQF